MQKHCITATFSTVWMDIILLAGPAMRDTGGVKVKERTGSFCCIDAVGGVSQGQKLSRSSRGPRLRSALSSVQLQRSHPRQSVGLSKLLSRHHCDVQRWGGHSVTGAEGGSGDLSQTAGWLGGRAAAAHSSTGRTDLSGS